MNEYEYDLFIKRKENRLTESEKKEYEKVLVYLKWKQMSERVRYILKKILAKEQNTSKFHVFCIKERCYVKVDWDSFSIPLKTLNQMNLDEVKEWLLDKVQNREHRNLSVLENQDHILNLDKAQNREHRNLQTNENDEIFPYFI